MKAFIVLAIVFVALMFGMKACSGGVGKLTDGFKGAVSPSGSKSGKPSSSPPGRKEDTQPVVQQGNGFTLHAEKFRGYMGLTGTLRTDQGQYTPGALCHHGRVVTVMEREAAIKGVSGMVFVVAVDDYTPVPQPVEPGEPQEKKNFLAPDPPAPVNASPSAAVPVVAVVKTAPAMADVPVEQSLKLTNQQKRQARTGVPIRVPVATAPAVRSFTPVK